MNEFLEGLKTLKESEDHIEFKEAKNDFNYNGGDHNDPKKRRHCVLGYVAALANEGGGRLVFGMADKKPHDIVGSSYETGNLGALEDAIYEYHGIRVRIDEHFDDGKRVVVFNVPSRPIGKMLRFEGVPLMRIGESLREMSDEEMRKILNEQEPDFSAKVCEGLTIDDLDAEAVRVMKVKYAQKQDNPQFESVPNEQAIRDLNLMEGNKLTYAALILLGKSASIRKWLPQNNVVVEYRYDPASIQYDAREEFQQPLMTGIDAIWAYLNQPLSNPMTHIGDDTYIFDILKFNREATREAILNAITHRSMQIQSDVVIKQSSRDLVITNAGGFPLGVDLNNILTVNSVPRQKLLAEVLMKTGLVEKSGQGVDKMFSLCIMESKPLPDYSGTDDYQVSIRFETEIRDNAFVVFVRHEQTKRPIGKKLNVFELIILYSIRFDGHLPENYNTDSLEHLIAEGLVLKNGSVYSIGGDYEIIRQKMPPLAKGNGKSPRESELTERQRIILGRIIENPKEMAEGMAKALGIGKRTLYREIAQLRKLGLIRKSDKDNRSPWVVLKTYDEEDA